MNTAGLFNMLEAVQVGGQVLVEVRYHNARVEISIRIAKVNEYSRTFPWPTLASCTGQYSMRAA